MSNETKIIEKKYQKLDPIEHILKRPGMYIGGTEEIESSMWVLDDNKIVEHIIKFIPGLFKIFDEIIVNAYDQTVTDPTVTRIKIDIDPDTNTFVVYNDGKGIDVVIHPKEKIYVPELIFGELLTSTHFGDDENRIRITGGLHGLGAKLTSIFSTEFEVEIGDPINNKKFYQKYKNHLSYKSKPKITPYTKSNGYVKITFKPDLSYFKLDTITSDFANLLRRRVYDLAMLAGKRINTYLNGNLIPITDLNSYTKMYIPSDILIESCKDPEVSLGRWRIAIAPAINKYQCISFVNGVNTYNGGKHVDYIVGRIVKIIKDQISRKHKDIDIRDQYIRDQLFVIIVSTIENPQFSSQSKDELMTPVTKFGSSCEFTDTFSKKLYGFLKIEDLVQIHLQAKESMALSKLTPTSKVKNIPKLYDAYYAGTKRSSECSLILTEGDSAKGMAISALSILNNSKTGYKGSDTYGVFPLKGKLLNVREATKSQISNNEEFVNLQKIIGLEIGKVYTSDTIKSLRYGSIILMMDADVDGSHIKGLFINMIDYFWPSLLQIKGFIKVFITPMIKATLKNETIEFYSMSDYIKWKNKTVNHKNYTIKYYKGLGTNTTDEAKSYFSNLIKHLIDLEWDDKTSKQAINLAFARELADDRKLWLKNYNKDAIIDYTKKHITYTDFINKELIHFSNYNNDRSIPSLVDGLKISQRKIIYGSFKKNLTSDIKVAQFVGYVGEMTSYHHDEASLAMTIIGMAQSFVGSNNVNLLFPSGQFGTRLMGGKDFASPRYIYTRLSDITRSIFHPDDDILLTYLNDDGFQIEPSYYIPVIPMILVNGTEGIGTGFSSNVHSYNPIDIIDIILGKLNKKKSKIELKPWYRGFKGSIQKISDTEYITKGTYTLENNVLTITELPIGTWTEPYKIFLEDTLVNDKLKGFVSKIKNNSDEANVEFVIKFKHYPFETKEDMEKIFQLNSKININNMYLHDANGHIKKYSTPLEIVNEFYDLRLKFYQMRKENLIEKLKEEIKYLQTKLQFIQLVITDKNIFKLTDDKILNLLIRHKIINSESDPIDYLLRMPFQSFTKEKVEELHKQIKNKSQELDLIRSVTIEQMWTRDLEKVREKLGS